MARRVTMSKVFRFFKSPQKLIKAAVTLSFGFSLFEFLQGDQQKTIRDKRSTAND